MSTETATRTEYRVEYRGLDRQWSAWDGPWGELRLAERERERGKQAHPTLEFRICERTIYLQRSSWRVRPW